MAAQAVTLENVRIYGFTNFGIELEPTQHANLVVKNSTNQHHHRDVNSVRFDFSAPRKLQAKRSGRGLFF
jgi:hypothetical protein